MSAYYNENDPRAAAWLRELIKANLIASGIVDERGIADVQPTDLHGYKQCHFFAGIGGWSYALRLAGIPDDEPIWTGSCPCQPFSAAGKQRGAADERHLWPEFFRLIRQRNPSTVFGEQVASKLGREWLSRVRIDLEGLAYAVGAADLCAASIGAPHIRQRLYWVADATSSRCNGQERWTEGEARNEARVQLLSASGAARGLADTQHDERRPNESRRRSEEREIDERISETSRLDNADGNGAERTGRAQQVADARCEVGGLGDSVHLPRPRLGSHRSELLPCADGKARRIEPGSFPLAHGVSGRVGLLRGYGNAIVPQVAAQFICAFYEALHDGRSHVLMSDPMF